MRPVDAAVRAAVSIVQQHGLEVAEPRLLSTSQAVIVHLGPAPLVARVGAEDVFGPRLVWQRGAVPFVRHLADVGAAVVPPSDLLPPGPHERDGLVVSFWRYVQGSGPPADPAAAGEALREIHELALGYEGELAPFWPPVEAQALLARADVAGALRGPELQLLRGVLERRLPERPEQPLHGDAHVWNTLQTADGPLWLDFDEACRGPLEWDAATMVESDLVLGPGADVPAAYEAAFGDRFEERDLAPWVELRVALIVLWLAAAGRTTEAPHELDRLLAWLRPRVA